MKFNNYKPFSLIESARLQSIREYITECEFAPGESIISIGEESTAYYIIKSGSVMVLQKMIKDEPEQVAVLGEGDGFGEDALINGGRQNETVRAIEETTVWIISKSDFDQILKTTFLEQISSEDIEIDNGRHKILDVRTEDEFYEEHIPGAIHIPLNRLRMTFSEIDRDSEYCVYCSAGVRSAVAAFLLRSQGIRAKNIKGGLSYWTGSIKEVDVNSNELLVHS